MSVETDPVLTSDEKRSCSAATPLRLCPPRSRALCDGKGIPDAALGHVFETFYTTKKMGEGTGLGLPVSYRLASDHGGWIGIESKVGKGSCFTLYLPPLIPRTPSHPMAAVPAEPV